MVAGYHTWCQHCSSLAWTGPWCGGMTERDVRDPPPLHRWLAPPGPHTHPTTHIRYTHPNATTPFTSVTPPYDTSAAFSSIRLRLVHTQK